MQEYDYVVVGAGSAGCAVAARLSESGQHRVALLEAGGNDDRFWIRTPIGFGKLYEDPTCNWLYQGEPEPNLGGTRSFQARGKVLGGTSSINGMVYMRGQKEDYDYWRQLGNVGWSYDDVLPYFRKCEDNEIGANEYHGTGGPLRVANVPRHELGEAFISAGEQAGFVRNTDFSGASQDGFGYVQMTIRDGRRSSAAEAYLKPARNRRNLHVITDALTIRVLFERNAATGVEVMRRGSTECILARREVILAAGVFNSPQLLQLSGIGPADHLRALGVSVMVDLPGVGANLQDHFTVSANFRCARPITLNDDVNSRARRMAMVLKYLLFHGGSMAMPGAYCAGCIRTDQALDSPDVKLNLQPWSRAIIGKAGSGFGLHPFSSFGISMNILHPESRGTVRIKSADPTIAPEIRFNFLAAEEDRRKAVLGFRAIRKVATMPAIAAYIMEEVSPGPSIQSDEDIEAFCRRAGRSSHHGTSTCKMGTDALAVVDHRLRVRGIGRLRVIDASIMPRLVGGNTNAPAIMIGEKGAAMVLEDT
ncbi:MAG: GMC family oxidoreductase [Dongiaceae bacterium]